MAMNEATHAGTAGDGSSGHIRFADVVVDVGAHTVTRGGEIQSLEPKAFAVLEVLLEQPGQLAPRDALLDRVWGHRHVTPSVLTRVVAQLRHALGDDPHNPHLIATQHGLGYRFIAEIEPEPAPGIEPGGVHPQEPGPAPPAGSAPTSGRTEAVMPPTLEHQGKAAGPSSADRAAGLLPKRRRRGRLALVIAVVLAVVLAAVALSDRFPRGTRDVAPPTPARAAAITGWCDPPKPMCAAATGDQRNSWTPARVNG